MQLLALAVGSNLTLIHCVLEAIRECSRPMRCITHKRRRSGTYFVQRSRHQEVVLMGTDQ